MTHEDYVSYEQAELLKELGFDWECSHGYYRFFDDKEPWLNTCGYAKNSTDGDLFYCAAPTLSQTQKWLREVKEISVEPFSSVVGKEWAYQLYHSTKDKFGLSIVVDKKNVKKYGFNNYEKALSAGIEKALKLLKEQNK